MICVVLTGTFIIVWSLLFSTVLDHPIYPWIGVGLGISGVVMIADIVFFVVTGYYEITLFVYLGTILVASDLVHFGQTTGLLDGILLNFSCIMMLLALKFSLKWFHQCFWGVVFLANITAAFSAEFFLTDLDLLFVNFIDLKYYPYSVTGAYFNVFGTITVFLAIIAVEKWKVSRRETMVKEIVKGIAELNLDSKVIVKLKKKDEKSCFILESFLKKIIENIEEYKKYLPSTLWNVAEITEFDALSNAENASNNSSEFVDSELGSVSDVNSLNSSSFGHHGSKKSARESLMNAKINLNIKSRNISVILTNISNFEKFLMNSKEHEVINLLSVYVERVSSIMKKNRGIVHQINGDKMLCSMNSVVMNMEHAKNACKAALDVSKIFSKGSPDSLDTFAYGISVRCCVISGEMFFGNIGSNKHRSFSFFGEELKRVYGMDKVKLPDLHRHRRRGESFVLVDENTFRSVEFNFVIRQVEFIKSVKTERLEPVFALFKERKNTKNDEWLYEIENYLQESKDEAKTIWEKIKEQNWEMAKKLLNNFKKKVSVVDSEKGDSNFLDGLICILEKKIKRKKNYSVKF